MPIYTLSNQSAITQHMKNNVRTGTTVFAASSTANVVFSPPFDTSNLYFSAIANDNVNPIISNITNGGFTIDVGVSFTGNVYWTVWS